MKKSSSWIRASAMIIVLLLIPLACSLPAQRPAPPVGSTLATTIPASSLTPTRSSPSPTGNPQRKSPNPPPSVRRNPQDFVSTERLLSYVEGLTSIQPYSGWRNSATQGEREALDYVGRELRRMGFLVESGLQIERQDFRVILATELWETRLVVRVDDQDAGIPVSGLRGSRDSLEAALAFDSDGKPNDDDRNPVQVDAAAVIVQAQAELDGLTASSTAGTLLFANYALFDRIILGEKAFRNATRVVEMSPAGIVLVTQFSNQAHESHGTYIGEGGVFAQIPRPSRMPVVYARLEDMSPAGIASWKDLAGVEAGSIYWDADVFSPGTSGNLIARLPGLDSSRALILSAHIDSANNPGAMDDGSGSAVLLEAASAINDAQTLPPVDTYLVWFGSEELGLFGSGYFANTHQDLLDKAVAMLQFDCMTRPLEGLSPSLHLITWPPTSIGDQTDPWSLHLQQAAGDLGIELTPTNLYSIASDNSSFAGYDVPNADVIFQEEPEMEEMGGVWFAGHIHDPYDTLELIRDVADPFTEMVRVAISAAFDTSLEQESFRVTPRPTHRALFIASHTEPVHMTPAALMILGMELSDQGFDVDVIPYGQAVTAADLQDVDLAIALPIVDYPHPEAGPEPYDEAWTVEEIDALTGYVDQGGLLVITNSARRLKYFNLVHEPNEDWADANSLAEKFGVQYLSGILQTNYRSQSGNPLMQGVSGMDSPEANPVPFEIETGEVLLTSGDDPAIALVSPASSSGQVLVMADVGFLGSGFGSPSNARFWQNLAGYARAR